MAPRPNTLPRVPHFLMEDSVVFERSMRKLFVLLPFPFEECCVVTQRRYCSIGFLESTFLDRHLPLFSFFALPAHVAVLSSGR